MKELHIFWGSRESSPLHLIVNALIFGIAVGVTEAIIIRLVMGALGMFGNIAIYG